MAETKLVNCIDCGMEIEISKFGSAKTAKCNDCKGTQNGSNKQSTPKKPSKPVEDNIPVGKTADATLSGITYDRVPDEEAIPINATDMGVMCGGMAFNMPGLDKIVLNRNRSETEATGVHEDGTIMFSRVPTEWENADNKLSYLSVSKISQYEQCPAQFYEIHMSGKYQEKDSGNFYTQFGTILHNTNERVETFWEENGIKVDYLKIFDEEWRKQPALGLEAYREAVGIIKDYYGKHPIGSHKYKPLMVLDDGADKPLSGIEYEFRGLIGGEVMFGCKFDYLGRMKDQPHVGLILDYKSNRMPFTLSQLESSLQLNTYELIAQRYLKFEGEPITDWVTGYDLYRYGWQQCPTRTERDLDEAEAYIINVWHQIKNDTKFEEKLNGLCGYCIRRHECKSYADFINNPDVYVHSLTYNPEDIGSMNDAREKLASYDKIIKTRKGELNSLIKSAIQVQALENKPLIANGREIYLQSQNKPFYNYTATASVMAVNGEMNLLSNCLKVDKVKLDRAVQGNPELQSELKDCEIANYTAPFINSRKAK